MRQKGYRKSRARTLSLLVIIFVNFFLYSIHTINSSWWWTRNLHLALTPPLTSPELGIRFTSLQIIQGRREGRPATVNDPEIWQKLKNHQVITKLTWPSKCISESERFKFPVLLWMESSVCCQWMFLIQFLKRSEKDRTTHGDIFELHWLSVFQTTSRPITLAVRSKRGRKKHVVGFKGVNAEYDSERKPGEKKKKKSCMNHELHD